MGKIRRTVLLVLVLLLVSVAVLTWGSIGSVVTVLCLLLMGAALVYQHFLINNDRDDFQAE